MRTLPSAIEASPPDFVFRSTQRSNYILIAVEPGRTEPRPSCIQLVKQRRVTTDRQVDRLASREVDQLIQIYPWYPRESSLKLETWRPSWDKRFAYQWYEILVVARSLQDGINNPIPALQISVSTADPSGVSHKECNANKDRINIIVHNSSKR